MTINFLNTKHRTLIANESLFDSAILDQISVTAPYFALRNLKCIDEFVHADFETELINIDEEGPISGAEVGRHMAILGSVVLAKENPKKERHHYLATDALITCHATKSPTSFSHHARAKMLNMNRKRGQVYGEILNNDGSLLYSVEVSYMILGHSIFERMFSEHKDETVFETGFNPYKLDSEFIDLEVGVESCKASIGVVKPEHCPGHFRNFPALPVARMGTSMGKIGGIHFMNLNPNEKSKYYISSAELHAKQLVFTGEEIKFRTEIVNPNPEKGMIIRTIAYSDKCDLIAESICNYHY